MDWRALTLSLELAAVTLVVLLPTGLWLGRRLAYGTFAGKAWIEALVVLPLVLPPTVLGYYLMTALGGGSPIGRWVADAFDVRITFTFSGLVVASVVFNIPFLVQPVQRADGTRPKRLAGGLVAHIEATLEPDLHPGPGGCHPPHDLDRRGQVRRDRLLAEDRKPRVHPAQDQLVVRGGRRGDDQRVDINRKDLVDTDRPHTEALRITARELLELGIVDGIVEEPGEGAHMDADRAAELLGDALARALESARSMRPEERVIRRYEKFRRMGRFAE